MTPDGVRTRRRSPCRVLIVDDHEETRNTERLVLEHFGFAVTEARTGLEALALAQADRPEVVLLDIELPAIDGRELARMFRADPAMRDSTLIAVSALGEREARDSAFEAGVDAFATKPVPPLDLVGLVRAGARRVRSEPTRPLDFDPLEENRADTVLEARQPPCHELHLD